MAARLYDKPMLPPFRCLSCSHSSADFGPYLHTGDEVASGSAVAGIIYCASCTATRIAALDVVPRKKLLEALEQVKRFEAVEHEACLHAEAARVANERADRLEGELEGVRGELEASQRARQELQQAAARERKERLLAEVAKPKPTKAKEAA
jgi:hypothetical protein